MAYVHGKAAKILVHEYDFSQYFNNVDFNREVDVQEVTTFGDNDREYIPGLRNSNLSIAGFWQASSAATPDPVVAADLANTSPILITYAPDGLAVGKSTYSVQTYHTAYNVTSPVDGVVGITLDAQGHGRVSRGVSMSNLTARTCGATGTVYNNGTTTLTGAIGYLHLTAISMPATSRLTISLQDSPTSTPSCTLYADFIAFTVISSDVATAERVVTSTNLIRKYAKSAWAITGASTVAWSGTFAITFERT